MNIWGYKLRLKKAKDMLKNAEQELNDEKRKRGKRRDYDLIESLTNMIKNIESGQQNLRNKIKMLKQERKRGK